MKKHTLLPTFIFLFTLLLQACDNSDSRQQSKVYPTAVGEDLSVTANDESAIMAPSIHALEEASKNIGHILKMHLVELNEQEAISFSKEMNYCDISGSKESRSSGTLQKFSNNKEYKTCKSDENSQNGNIELTYSQTESDGKYPKTIRLLVKEAYTFNDMLLQRDLLVESEVLYNEDKSLNKISLEISGLVDFNYQTLAYDKFEQKINFP